MRMTMLSPADAIAENAASAAGPKVGVFFDLDSTLVDGFTAAVHVGDRIRRRQLRCYLANHVRRDAQRGGD